MKQDSNDISVGIIIKKLMFWFGISLLVISCFFLWNHILLILSDILYKHPPGLQITFLIIYSLPSIIVMSAPCAVCTGFVWGLITLNNKNGIFKNVKAYKKLLSVTLALGMVISVFTFVIEDRILPDATMSFSKLHRSILVGDGTEDVNDATGETITRVYVVPDTI